MTSKFKSGTSEDVKKYAKLKDQQRKLEKDIKGIAAKAFHYGCRDLFKNNPDLKSFSWDQYTPYFNDGEECVFSANTDHPYVNGLDSQCFPDDFSDNETDTSGLSDDELYSKFAGVNKKLHNQLLKNVEKFLKSFKEEEYQQIFGDHVKIRVTKNDIEVEAYEHG